MIVNIKDTLDTLNLVRTGELKEGLKLGIEEIDTYIRLYSPNLAKVTTYGANCGELGTAGLGVNIGGMLNNTTQYTDLTFYPLTGTLTGGTIRVYGYQN